MITASTWIWLVKPSVCQVPWEVTVNINVDLPHELERTLEAEADRMGISLREYVIRLVLIGRRHTDDDSVDVPTTGAELVAIWEHDGVIGSRPEIIDPEKHSRTVRAQAERQVRG
jgi:hypothetical protein